MYRSRHRSTFGISAVVLVVLIVLGGVGYAAIYRGSAKELTCTVKSMDRVARSDGNGSDARIYTEQCGVLENTDSFLFGKFNSADVQGAIQPGHTYDVKVAGWRIGLFSAFPNIIEVHGEHK